VLTSDACAGAADVAPDKVERARHLLQDEQVAHEEELAVERAGLDANEARGGGEREAAEVDRFLREVVEDRWLGVGSAYEAHTRKMGAHLHEIMQL
jgi:hypothetical protein